MTPSQIPSVIRRLKKASQQWEVPYVGRPGKRDPFQVLVSCLLSLRTRDEVTAAASSRLFALADSPLQTLALHPRTMEKAIYPAAFYRVKTKTLRRICQELVDRHGGKVPDSIDELLKFKGVGRKTANLTVILGYDKPGICVDTHVHRIANRWGYVATRSPDETEMALRKKLPRRYWKELNDLLVALGQNCCKPISPICSACCVAQYCRKTGVQRSR